MAAWRSNNGGVRAWAGWFRRAAKLQWTAEVRATVFMMIGDRRTNKAEGGGDATYAKNLTRLKRSVVAAI
ncbi:MAG: hypothetical protein WD875_10220 [Pirellulales bacterium]